MRLNKYIAASGTASRRKADELVFNGNVRVNGMVVKEPGYQVQPDDTVEVNGSRIIASDKKVYIAMNKPLGYVTTMKDQFGRPAVADLVTDIEERVFPVGRLDYNTTGLLLLTNDGDLAYRVRVAGWLSDTKIAKLRRGVDIGGYVTARAQVKVVKQMERSTVVEITIHEGKNRQVRKMFRAVGCPVQELERISIGDIRLGRLSPGHYRKLTKQEIDYLKKNV